VKISWTPRLAITAALGAVLLLGACGQQPASPASAPPSSGPAASGQPGTAADPLGGLVALAIERIDTADLVSAAKFGTPQPIDDPAREQQVLNAVAAQSPGMGVSPTESAQFFRDQIEANKVVQRGLYQQWTAHPALRPATKPDLTTLVRPVLDRLTPEIMQQLRATTAARHGGDRCTAQLGQASAAAAAPLDQLHRDALAVALRSVCVSSP
jgi:chorismate mutase